MYMKTRRASELLSSSLLFACFVSAGVVLPPTQTPPATIQLNPRIRQTIKNGTASNDEQLAKIISSIEGLSIKKGSKGEVVELDCKDSSVEWTQHADELARLMPSLKSIRVQDDLACRTDPQIPHCSECVFVSKYHRCRSEAAWWNERSSSRQSRAV